MTLTLSFRKKIMRAFDSGRGLWFFLLSFYIARLETGHIDVQMKFDGTHIVFFALVASAFTGFKIYAFLFLSFDFFKSCLNLLFFL